MGAPHAEIMEREKLCLEEYVDALRISASGGQPFSLPERGVEIHFVRADEEALEIPDDAVAQVSGNNVDGFVITSYPNK